MNEEHEAIQLSLARNEIDERQATKLLRDVETHGGFEGNEYSGFDYCNQVWIRFSY